MSNRKILRSRLVPLAGCLLLALAVTAAAPKKPARAVSPKPPLDFSGTWVMDPATSLNVSSAMQGAVLRVHQTGNRIWISPEKVEGSPRPRILSEEVVADGHPYEKALGPAGKGLVTAAWAPDGKSLRIEVQAGPPEDRDSASQRSIWRLTEDRQIWIRESISVSKGVSSRARLVFRRKKA